MNREGYSPAGLYQQRLGRGMVPATQITREQEAAFWKSFAQTQHVNLYTRQLAHVARNLQLTLRGEPADRNATLYTLALPVHAKFAKSLEGRMVILPPEIPLPELLFTVDQRRKHILLLNADGELRTVSYAPTEKQKRAWQRELKRRAQELREQYDGNPKIYRSRIAELQELRLPRVDSRTALQLCAETISQKFPSHNFRSLEFLLEELRTASRDKAIERVRLYELPFRDGIHHNGNGNGHNGQSEED